MSLTIPSKIKSPLLALGLIGLGSGAAIGSCTVPHYSDLPGFSNDSQSGRTINGVSTLVGGIIGETLYGDSQIDLTAEKFFFPDSEITGTTSRERIDVECDLLFTSSHFTARREKGGVFTGAVEKSEYNWDITQNSSNTWGIERAGWKLDTMLELNIDSGVITGAYKRPFELDWDINGTYDHNGKIDVEIDVPWGPDVELVGQICSIAGR